MNTLPKAPRDEAASAPAPSQANPPLRILVSKDDTSIRESTIEVLVHSDHQVDAAEARRRNTAYRHWGINE